MAIRGNDASDHELTLLSLHGRIGQWWESGAPDSKFAGSLEVDGDQIRLYLAILGPNHPFSVDGSSIATLCGLVDGKAITLIECLATNENWSDRDDTGYSARIAIRPDLILIGQFHANRDGKYSTVGFSTNEVRKVFRVHPLKRIDPIRDIETVALAPDADMSAEEFRRSCFALVELPNLNCFHSDIAAVRGSISFQFAASHSINREIGPSAAYTPRLLMELQEPVSLYRLLRHARQSTHLLSLISITPNYCLDIDVSQNAQHPESWKLFQNGRQRTKGPSELNDWQVLLRFPEHRDHYPALWSRWFETRKDHAVSRWIFQSSLEQGYRFDINRFLNVMQCLEILTKLYADGTAMDKTEFEKFCTIVETEATRHMLSDNLLIATRMLRQQNRPPLAMRLRSLVSRIDSGVLRWLLGNELQALDLAVKARNYFTHFGDLSATKRELVEQNLGLLTCKMSTLYVVLELDIMGVPPSVYLSTERFGLPWMMRHAADRHVPPAA